MDFKEILLLTVDSMLVTNVIFARFLGLCPYMGVSQKTSTALGMGGAVVFVMVIATAASHGIQVYMLDPLGIGYLQTITFILVIAGLVQFVEIVMKKVSKGLYQALGIYLPLITTNCAILGIAILAVQNEYSLIESVFFALGSSLGFALALVIFSGIRERMAMSYIPKAMEGIPAALVTAGILSMAFIGFSGLVKL